jgi:hypothetical protein
MFVEHVTHLYCNSANFLLGAPTNHENISPFTSACGKLACCLPASLLNVDRDLNIGDSYKGYGMLCKLDQKLESSVCCGQ